MLNNEYVELMRICEAVLHTQSLFRGAYCLERSSRVDLRLCLGKYSGPISRIVRIFLASGRDRSNVAHAADGTSKILHVTLPLGGACFTS